MVDAFCFYIFNGNSCSLSLVRQNSKNDCFFPRHCRYIVCRSFRGHNSRNLTTIKFRALFVDTTQQQLADGASKKSEHETPFVRPRTNIQFVGYIYIGSEAVNGGTSQNTIILFFFLCFLSRFLFHLCVPVLVVSSSTFTRNGLLSSLPFQWFAHSRLCCSLSPPENAVFDTRTSRSLGTPRKVQPYIFPKR